jgi:hypothetical protein
MKPLQYPVWKRTINLSLLLVGIMMVGSGLLLQFSYHMGHHDGIVVTDTILGGDYYFWSWFHRLVAILFTLLLVLHWIRNFKWVQGVLKKRLLGKHRQVFIFSAIFIFAALTGFSAWAFSLLPEGELLQKGGIEIHDKITLVLFVFLALHVWQRRNRMGKKQESKKI